MFPITKNLFGKQHFFFFFLRNNYNILLTLQFEPFPPRLPSTLCMGRCQFNYKSFGNLFGKLKTLRNIKIVMKTTKELFLVLYFFTLVKTRKKIVFVRVAFWFLSLKSRRIQAQRAQHNEFVESGLKN